MNGSLPDQSRQAPPAAFEHARGLLNFRDGSCDVDIPLLSVFELELLIAGWLADELKRLEWLRAS